MSPNDQGTETMNRRLFVLTLGGIVLTPLMLSRVPANSGEQAMRGPKIVRSEVALKFIPGEA